MFLPPPDVRLSVSLPGTSAITNDTSQDFGGCPAIGDGQAGVRAGMGSVPQLQRRPEFLQDARVGFQDDTRAHGGERVG